LIRTLKTLRTSFTSLALIVAALLSGCGRSDSSTSNVAHRARSLPTDKQRGEILVGTMDTLFNFQEQESRQALDLAVGRLNQWIRGQKVSGDWSPSPLVETLPADYQKSKWIEKLADTSFHFDYDGHFLLEAVWLSRIARHVGGDIATAAADSPDPLTSPLAYTTAEDPPELRLAARLFDWTIRNIQLETDDWPTSSQYKLPRRWHTPYETVVLGRGTASDRAWVFMILARQQGLDVVMLAVKPETSSETGGDLREWIPALVLTRGNNESAKTDLYLFDPRLGLPILALDAGKLATLREIAANDKLLRQLDVDSKTPYTMKSDDLEEVTALIEAGPGYLSRRMEVLENNLGGEQRVVLTAPVAALAEKLKSVEAIGPRVALWPRPYETAAARVAADERTRSMAAFEMAPFEQLRREIVESATDRKVKSRREEAAEWSGESREQKQRQRVPLGIGRLHQLAGNYSHEDGAVLYLNQAQYSDREQDEMFNAFFAQNRTGDEAKVIVAEARRSDSMAKLWLGQIKAEQGDLDTAVKYFTTWDNPIWKGAVAYNLARVYETQGRLDQAIKIYQEDESPQRPGNLLRSRRLRALADGR
jgi:tetratricopeptide (TPR) repeat protein